MNLENSPGSGRAENRSTRLLTKDENEQIFRLLGQKCLTLSTCIVQLYITEPPHHLTWMRRDCGVLCFVKDNFRRSYFFRLYCPVRLTMVWEQEIYTHIKYNDPRPFLHTFEGEDCIVAFNFADETEAKMLLRIIKEKIESRKQRKMERRSRYSMEPPPERPQPLNGPTPPSQAGPALGPKPVPNQVQQQQGRSLWPTKRGRDKDGLRRLTKADIGQPQDFRHVTHVGWDPNKGFDVDNVEDPQLKQFFVKAGVSESQLKDRETRDFIYDFINRHGGLDAVKEEVIQAIPQAVAMQSTQPGPPPPVPARSAPPPAENKPPPSWSGQVRSAPPPPPSRTVAAPTPTAAPPPPPSRSAPPPKPPMPVESGSSPAVPPPPPPPPMMPPPEPAAPPAPTPAVSAPPQMGGGAPDPRSALLDAIKKGKQLKHVEPGAGTSAAAAPSTSGDARGDLLDQIRQGIELRPVVPSAGSASSRQDVASQNSLAGALARALAERSRVIHSDSDSSSEEDEDEWD